MIDISAQSHELKEEHVDTLKISLLTCYSNKSAWMTATVFGEWLTTVNHQMKKYSWKILLFVDIATGHHGAKLVKFLLLNWASKVHPQNWEVIQSIKAFCLKKMFQ